MIILNYGPDCVVALWEGPQLLLAKVKDADRQDWYIYISDYWRELLVKLGNYQCIQHVQTCLVHCGNIGSTALFPSW